MFSKLYAFIAELFKAYPEAGKECFELVEEVREQVVADQIAMIEAMVTGDEDITGDFHETLRKVQQVVREVERLRTHMEYK